MEQRLVRSEMGWRRKEEEGLLQNILSRTHTQKTLFETYLMMS